MVHGFESIERKGSGSGRGVDGRMENVVAAADGQSRIYVLPLRTPRK